MIDRAGIPVAKVVPLVRRVNRTAVGSLAGQVDLSGDWTRRRPTSRSPPASVSVIDRAVALGGAKGAVTTIRRMIVAGPRSALGACGWLRRHLPCWVVCAAIPPALWWRRIRDTTVT